MHRKITLSHSLSLSLRYLKTRCKLRRKKASDVLTHWQEASHGRSKPHDLDRTNIRYQEDTEPDQDVRLVTCELSSLV